MSGEAVLVPLVWQSITGVAEAVEATVGARKEAARRAAEAERERIQAWRDFQSRQHRVQEQLSRARAAAQQAQQQLINGGLREAAKRLSGEAVAEGFVQTAGPPSAGQAPGLMAHIERQLSSLPGEWFQDERLPFARLRGQLERLRQAAATSIDEIDDLGRTLQRSLDDYCLSVEREAEQRRRQMADAEHLLTEILQARALNADRGQDMALQRLQQKLTALLAEANISPAALDVISNSFSRLRDTVERAVTEDEMNEFLAERVTHHLNTMGYETYAAFSDRQSGGRRDAEFLLPDGDRLRVALQPDLKIGFQLTHESRTVIEKTLSGEGLSFFRQQEARWCRDMKELIRRLVKDGIPYAVQFEREIPGESISVVAVEGVEELLDEEEQVQGRQRRRRQRHFS